MSRCPSDVSLEAVIFAGDDDAFVVGHLEECAGCRARLDELAGAAESFVAPTQEVRSGSESLQQVMAGLKAAPLGKEKRMPWIWPAVIGGIVLLAAIGFAATRGDREAATEPVTQPAAMPFTIEGGRGYASITGALAEAPAGAVIEIGAAKVSLPNGLAIEQPVTLRAAAGHEPSLRFGAPLVHRAPLRMEGLRLVSGGAALIESYATLAISHTVLHLDGKNPGVLVSMAGGRLDAINCAFVATGSRAISLRTEAMVRIENCIITTPTGFDLALPVPAGAEIEFVRSSFHGREFARIRGEFRGATFAVEQSAIDCALGIITGGGGAAISWAGASNLYPPGTTIPGGDIGAGFCPMDLKARILHAIRSGTTDYQQNLRPSTEAARRFPDRGFDPKQSGLGEAYQRFRVTDTYLDWRATLDKSH